MTNVWKSLRCPYDTGVSYFDRRLCVREECDTTCVWRYDVEGNRPKEKKENPEVVEIAVLVKVKVGSASVEIWV